MFSDTSENLWNTMRVLRAQGANLESSKGLYRGTDKTTRCVITSLRGRGLWLGGRAIIQSTKLPAHHHATNRSIEHAINQIEWNQLINQSINQPINPSSVEVNCWDNLLRSSGKISCWYYMLTLSVKQLLIYLLKSVGENICWTQLLKWSVEIICWDQLLQWSVGIGC